VILRAADGPPGVMAEAPSCPGSGWPLEPEEAWRAFEPCTGNGAGLAVASRVRRNRPGQRTPRRRALGVGVYRNGRSTGSGSSVPAYARAARLEVLPVRRLAMTLVPAPCSRSRALPVRAAASAFGRPVQLCVRARGLGPTLTFGARANRDGTRPGSADTGGEKGTPSIYMLPGHRRVLATSTPGRSCDSARWFHRTEPSGRGAGHVRRVGLAVS